MTIPKMMIQISKRGFQEEVRDVATTTDVRSEWGGELCNCAGVLGAGTAERVGAPTGACSDVMAKKDVIKEAFFVCS